MSCLFLVAGPIRTDAILSTPTLRRLKRILPPFDRLGVMLAAGVASRERRDALFMLMTGLAAALYFVFILASSLADVCSETIWIPTTLWLCSVVDRVHYSWKCR
jgi:hypothetical protein